MCVSEIKYKYISSISSFDDDLLVAESIKFKIDNLIDMVLLGCSKIIIPLPN